MPESLLTIVGRVQVASMQSTMSGTSLFGIGRPVESTGTKALLASWRELVYKCIADLKSKYPRSNDSQLAARIRVNRTSFIRFTSEIQKPQLENYLKLVVGSGNGHLASEALRLYDEDLGKVFEGVFESKTNINVGISSKYEEIICSRGLYIPLVLIMKTSGATFEEVENVVGDTAKQNLEDLIELGIAIHKDGRYCLKEKNLNLNFSRIHRQKNLQTLIGYYKAQRAETHINYSHSFTEGVNQAGAIRLRELHAQFALEAEKILDDENYKGEIPYFSVSLCDSLTSELFERIRQLNEGGVQ